MPAVESIPNNLRRIVILVASVDAATARQLLLQLPTEVAKEVRRSLQRLGPVDPVERQRIITEFQATAARQVRSAPQYDQATQRIDSATQRNDYRPQTVEPHRSQQINHQLSSANPSQPGIPLPIEAAITPGFTTTSEYALGSSTATRSAADETPDSKGIWKRMDTRALSRFLAGERPTVIAVVISQLAPELGVELLQQLPVEMHSDVLQRLVHLQDIDSEAMQAIDDHLAERLKDYEHQVNSEAESTRRVSSLIALAPAPLQRIWLSMLREANTSSTFPDTNAQAQETPGRAPLGASAQVYTADINPAQALLNNEINPYLDMFGSVITTADSPLAANAPHSTVKTIDEVSPPVTVAPSDNSHIIPFPGPTTTVPLNNVDRSLLQLDFERILQLSSQQLAHVLTQADSQTVLLALAGASPGFMKRFYLLLTKSDAKILASRLSQIGPLKLRDIDEAQRQIVELTGKLFSSSNNRTRTVRAAA